MFIGNLKDLRLNLALMARLTLLQRRQARHQPILKAWPFTKRRFMNVKLTFEAFCSRHTLHKFDKFVGAHAFFELRLVGFTLTADRASKLVAAWTRDEVANAVALKIDAAIFLC